jgi:serine/threonine-protein kinase
MTLTGAAIATAGRYVIGESFASGGMGAVHLGRVRGAGGFARTVAVKRLFPGFANDAGFRQALLDEARLVSRISHPNVVPTLDVWEEQNDLYVVMEYVHGISLARLLKRGENEPIPIGIALGILECVLSGLHAAHEARSEDGTPLGMVHRDVSPQNILVGADGVARIIDFGIAKAATGVQVTDPGVVKGKTGYMAPEQLVGQRVSRQADIFAASAVLWEALTNRALLDEHGEDSISRRLTESENVPPSRYREGVSGELDAVVLRGLALKPSDRFPTAEALVTAIRKVAVPAPAVEIARWVREAASEELELSEERVRLFEQSPESSASLPSIPTPPSSASGLTSAVTKSEKGARGEDSEISGVSRSLNGGKGRAAMVVAAIGGVLLLLAVVGIRWSREARFAGSDARAAHESVQPPIVATVTTPAPSGGVASAKDSAPSASSPPALARPSSSPSSVKAAPAGARPRKASCDPPYTLDASGRKTYDPRCF